MARSVFKVYVTRGTRYAPDKGFRPSFADRAIYIGGSFKAAATAQVEAIGTLNAAGVSVWAIRSGASEPILFATSHAPSKGCIGYAIVTIVDRE